MAENSTSKGKGKREKDKDKGLRVLGTEVLGG